MIEGSPIKVTIMIPTYNQASYIRQAVTSALSQDYPHLEVIVGDDCSVDETAEIICAINDSRLRYIRNQYNLGRVGNYRNLLYNHANGDYVINLDGDDYFTDQCFISEAVKLIEKLRDTVIVVGRVRVKTASESFCSAQPKILQMMGIELLRKLPKSEYHFMHMATLYSRAKAVHLDFYRLDVVSADWESLYRLSIRGRVQFLNREIGVWRIHGDNTSLKASYLSTFENLSIWPNIYQDASKFGFGKLQAIVAIAKCISFFAQANYPPISKYGNVELIKFIALIFRSYPIAILMLLINPKYLAKLMASFIGYYRGK